MEQYPHNPQAEQAALALMIQSRDSYDTITTQLTADDFYTPENRTTYETLKTAGAPLTVIDAPSIATQLSGMHKLETVGGMEGLANLVTAAPTLSNARYYIQVLREEKRKRDIIRAGIQLQQIGSTSDAPADSVAAVAMEIMMSVDMGDVRDPQPAYKITGDMLAQLEELQQNPDASSGVPTGFTCIDNVTHGLRAGQMIVIAGRPAMGKSTLGVDFARSAALHHNVPTVVFSLEMSGGELAQRIVAAETGVSLSVFNNPSQLNAATWAQLNSAYKALQESPNFYIDDTADASLASISAKSRKLHRQLLARGGQGLGMIVVDYLQLMSSGVREENRQNEVSKFSRGMKLLAKELKCPVVVLSQLNRSSEMRSDKKPLLSDLRESGAIEQDADVVFLVHRPDVYDRENRPGEADIILAKHRNGPTDTFSLAFNGACSCFQEMAQDYWNVP